MTTAAIEDAKRSAEQEYRVLVLSSAQRDDVDPNKLREVLPMCGRTLRDFEHHSAVAHRRFEAAHVGDRQTPMRKIIQEARAEHQKHEAEAGELQQQIRELQRQLGHVANRSVQARNRVRSIEVQLTQESRDADNTLRGTAPSHRSQVEAISRQKAPLEHEQQRDWRLRSELEGSVKGADGIRYQIEECEAAGQPVPSDLAGRWNAIQARAKQLDQVKQRMQERAATMQELDRKMQEAGTAFRDWKNLDWRSVDEIEHERHLQEQRFREGIYAVDGSPVSVQDTRVI